MIKKIIHNKDLDSFKNLSSTDTEFLKIVLSYLVPKKSYKIDINGEIRINEFDNIYYKVKNYFVDTDFKEIKDIFDYIVENKRKIKFKKIFRYSSDDLNTIEKNFFKSLINNDVNFSCRYGKELFLRDKNKFFQITSKVALFNYSYKSHYISNLIELLNSFPKAIDELLQSYFGAYCSEDNNFLFYNRAYFTKVETNKRNFEENLKDKNYSFLKYNILQDENEAINFLKMLINDTLPHKYRTNLISFIKLKEFLNIDVTNLIISLIMALYE